MPNATAKSIKELYDDGMREVFQILGTGNAEQRTIARETLDDLTAMMLAHTLDNVQGRTALLTGLITELTEVIDAVRVQNPALPALAGITAVINGARTRLAKEKKNLLPSNG